MSWHVHGERRYICFKDSYICIHIVSSFNQESQHKSIIWAFPPLILFHRKYHTIPFNFQFASQIPRRKFQDFNYRIKRISWTVSFTNRTRETTRTEIYKHKIQKKMEISRCFIMFLFGVFSERFFWGWIGRDGRF